MGHRLALLVTGASGMRLPIHALRRMAAEEDLERLHLVVSKGAMRVLRHELDKAVFGGGERSLVRAAELSAAQQEKIILHRQEDLAAPIASGSYRLDGTVVLPCSSGTLGALAAGFAETLVRRAGAVALKEGWPLVLGFRETPLSLVHIENMRRLAYLGAIILPPIPAFYVGGEELERFLDAYVMRIFDCLRLPVSFDEGLRWSGGADGESS